MHFAAESGAAKHAAYKGGFSEDPGAADALAELVAAANAAAEQRFGAFADSAIRLGGDVRTAASPSSPSAGRSLRPRVPDVRPGRRRARHRDELRSVIGEVARSGDGNRRFRRFAVRLAVCVRGRRRRRGRTAGILGADEDGTVSGGVRAVGRRCGPSGNCPAPTPPPPPPSRGPSSSRYSSKRATRDATTTKTTKTKHHYGTSEAGENDNMNDVSTENVDGAVVSENFSATTTNTVMTRVRTMRSIRSTKAFDRGCDLRARRRLRHGGPTAPARASAPRVRARGPMTRSSKALRESRRRGGWQLVWDLTRAGRPETTRALLPAHVKTPDVTGLWEQWARFELMRGDAERARELYRAALLPPRVASARARREPKEVGGDGVRRRQPSCRRRALRTRAPRAGRRRARRGGGGGGAGGCGG